MTTAECFQHVVVMAQAPALKGPRSWLPTPGAGPCPVRRSRRHHGEPALCRFLFLAMPASMGVGSVAKGLRSPCCRAGSNGCDPPSGIVCRLPFVVDATRGEAGGVEGGALALVPAWGPSRVSPFDTARRRCSRDGPEERTTEPFSLRGYPVSDNIRVTSS